MNGPLAIPFRALMPMVGRVVENGTLLIERGRISTITREDPPAGMRVLDARDALILPGFVNAHCHLSLSALAGRLPKARPRFTDWVRDLLRENARIGAEERAAAFEEGAAVLLASGVSGLGDHLDPTSQVEAYAALPQRQVLFLETLGFQKTAAPATLQTVRDRLGAGPAGPLARFGLAPHAPYSVSADLFKALCRLARERGLRLSCHVAEFAEELRFLREGGGEMEAFLRERGAYDETFRPPAQSPLGYLTDLGVLDGLLAVHLNHIDGDIDLLARHGARAVFCPGSTRWFGRDRWVPVRELLDRGVVVALGTDSLASNESLNFFRELRLAEAMLPEVSRMELLTMATRMGAEALGLESGVLAPGRPADLIGLKIEMPPKRWEDVPFAPGRESVDWHVIAGEVVAGLGGPG